MTKFLELIATELLKSGKLHHKIVVLPNKRSAVFLKKYLANQSKKPVLAPKIVSIQDFLTELSPYQPADWLVLMFEFYQAYQSQYNDKAQSFDDFLRWAPTVLQDFNDIDNFNVNAKEVFTYINEVKKIEDWQLQPDSPKMITDYLKFYASLNDLYHAFQKRLIEQGLAYTGMINRYVAKHIEENLSQFDENQIVFAGFNALTETQRSIIKTLVHHQKAKTYWDADEYFLKSHFEAGKYIKQHQKDYPDFSWLFNNFDKPKHIEIIGVPGKITQAQAIAGIIAGQQSGEEEQLDDTAVVLNEDDLLLPIINSLPEAIDSVNITLGLPLKHLPVVHFFELLVELYAGKEQYGRFNIDTIVNIINQNHFEQILSDKEISANQDLLQKLRQFKTNLITQDLWKKTFKDSKSVLKKLIFNDFSIQKLLDLFLEFIDFLAQKNLNEIDSMALVKLEQVFRYLQDFIAQTNAITSMRNFKFIFNKLLQQERLAFEGEPLVGLQIMGMLETRLLDFDHVIITSMNEGVIPKAKNDRSIIPFELKKHFGLPQNHHQNAIIAYHFYRLLQRAKKITLVYNTAGDGFGAGEQSRFITQLKNELDTDIHKIDEKIIGLTTDLKLDELETVPKTPYAIERLKTIAKKGFSPSALTTYIRNPLVYYKRYILELDEDPEITDAIPSNIIGTIIHDVMEDLYKPYIGKELKIKDFDNFFKKYPNLALAYFIKESFGDDAPVDKSMITGKNLIIFEIIKKNIKDLLSLDKKTVKDGNRLQIVGLEQYLRAPVKIKGEEVLIHGMIDRIDRLNGRLRVIDYKTGKVGKGDISIGLKSELSEIRENDKKAKIFQLLTYAWLYYKNAKLLTTDLPFTAGILSTRQIKNGLLVAEVIGNTEIGVETIKAFEKELVILLDELFDTEMPFIEKDTAY